MMETKQDGHTGIEEQRAEPSAPHGMDSEKLGTETAQDWSDEEERRAVRRLDCLLMPLLVCGFFALQLDRSNISNALTSTITEDLGVSRRDIATGNQLQLVAILLAEIPANLALQKVGSSLWLTAQCVCWGAVGMAQACIRDKSSYYATRFLLGAFEAGYIPGAMLLMSLFYKRKEIALRTAVFYFGNYFSAGTGSLIAAGVLRMAVDGSATIVMAIAFFFLLPAGPDRTLPICRIKALDMFSDRDRHIMRTRVVLDDPMKGESLSRLNFRDVLKTLCNYRLWGHFAVNLLGLVPKGGLQLYSPTIIKALGFDTTRANALASVSNYGVCVLSFAASWASDRTRRRGPACLAACAFPLLFAGVLYGLPPGAGRWTRYAVFTLLGSGNGIVQTLNDAWLSSNAQSHGERSLGLALAVSGSNLGGLAGQQLFQDDDAPRYRKAFIAVLCLYFGAMAMVCVQMAIYMWGNKTRATASVPEEGSDVNRGDKPKRFEI